MNKSSKTKARERINAFFAKDAIDREGARKIKRLAMQFNIRLGKNRARFCHKCYGGLEFGRMRMTKVHKTITCRSCGFNNKIRIS
ncbi:MAG TPA: hypothetical protein VJK07_02725 [Candidatus Nanoarchaeia archaeon]|nr:hypothetical protein [Candidatus Nanoarchaeia archaeon]